MTDRDHHDYLGYNYRMNEIAAAMGIVQLKKIESLNQKRIENSLYLIEELNRRSIPWLKTLSLREEIKHTFFWCPILIDEEKLGFSTQELVKKLEEKGVETRHRYQEPLYKQRVLENKKIDYKNLYLENAEKVAGKVIGLPNHPGLNKEELNYIIKILCEF